MSTCTIIIYHCQHCGRVAEDPPDRSAPTCCGEAMSNAASRSVAEREREPGDRGVAGGMKRDGPASRPGIPNARS